MVVADHSDGFGIFPRLFAGDPTLLADPQIRKWYEMIQAGKGMEVAFEIVQGQTSGQLPKTFVLEGFDSSRPGFRSAWHEEIEAAEEANEPGRFTALIGYEWTSNNGGDGAGNLHRNVIFRDNADKASLVDPITTAKPWGSPDPRELWKWMAAYEEKRNNFV